MRLIGDVRRVPAMPSHCLSILKIMSQLKNSKEIQKKIFTFSYSKSIGTASIGLETTFDVVICLI